MKYRWLILAVSAALVSLSGALAVLHPERSRPEIMGCVMLALGVYVGTDALRAWVQSRATRRDFPESLAP